MIKDEFFLRHFCGTHFWLVQKVPNFLILKLLLVVTLESSKLVDFVELSLVVFATSYSFA